MIGYVLLGTNDLQQSKEFYNKILAPLGVREALVTDRIYSWANDSGIVLGVCNPADGNPATFGNGTMVALKMESKESVDATRELAIELGAETSEVNENGNFYGVYVRDPDHNKLCFFNM